MFLRNGRFTINIYICRKIMQNRLVDLCAMDRTCLTPCPVTVMKAKVCFVLLNCVKQLYFSKAAVSDV